jgi:hypothetical protein
VSGANHREAAGNANRGGSNKNNRDVGRNDNRNSNVVTVDRVHVPAGTRLAVLQWGQTTTSVLDICLPLQWVVFHIMALARKFKLALKLPPTSERVIWLPVSHLTPTDVRQLEAVLRSQEVKLQKWFFRHQQHTGFSACCRIVS